MILGGIRISPRRALAGVLVVATSLPMVGVAYAAAAKNPAPVPPSISPNVSSRFATDQLIVKMKDGSVPNLASLMAQAGEKVQLKRVESNGAWVGKLSSRRSEGDMQTLAAKIAALPGVAYAEPDAIMVPLATPTDPNYGAQWDLVAPVAGSYGANLPTAWDTSKGTSDVVVAVIDTGITNHADLAGQTVPGYDMISDPLVANDGDGRDADPSDPGDWVTSADTLGYFAGCGVSNSSWHGTHVAGTIAALQNNGIGITGIAPGVKVEPVRVLGKCGGYTSDIADALRWAAGLNVPGVPANANPASVLSLSLGGTGACPATYTQAISDITAIGASVVIAAGNSNADAAGFNPGNCPGVITVASTGPTGNRAYYSNFGTSVEIAAPGGDTTVTAPAGATSGGILSTLNAGLTVPTTDTYAYYQGTSMATPHVSGVAALIKSVDPAATPAQVLSFIQNNVTAFPAGSTCTTALCGTGILNAASAVSAAATAYGPRVLGAFSKTLPAAGSVAVTDPVTLTWTASTGATSYDYCLVATLTAPCTWTTVGNVTSVTVSGLTPGALYSWQVRATDGTHTAEANVSLRSSFTTWAPLPAPTAFGKTAPANLSQVGGPSATLSWAASTNAVTYEYCLDNNIDSTCTGTWTSVGSATSVVVSGLVAGTNYEWQVRAVNPTATTLADTGTFWSFADVAAIVPLSFAKTSPATGTTAFGATVPLTWAASTNATAYAVCLDSVINNACDGVWNQFTNVLSVSAINLVAGTTYEWQVRASNANGTLLADGGTSFTFTDQAALPGAFNKSTPATGSVGLATTPTLAWNASAGAVSYEYCIDTTNDNACTAPAVWTTTGTTRTAAQTGLANSTTYYWQARARNTSGTTDANAGAWWSFTTAAPALPAAFNKTAPATAATGVAIAPTLSWAASTTAVSYEYCIDTTNDNACTAPAVWTTTAAAARTAALSGLSYSTTYYWQVRSRNAVGTTDANAGAWWSFTTVAPPALGAFNKTAPATAATGQGSTGTVTLTWGASTNATSFEYCIDATIDNACTAPAVWTTTPVLATRSVAFTGFAWNTKYEWQVRARGAIGTLDANTGTWFTFTTLAAPASPSKTSPTNAQAARPLTQALSWGTATGATSYEYCIDTNNNGLCDTSWISTGTARTVSPAGLVTKTTYSWQVRARNAAGTTEGNAGVWWTFTTA